ncbi:MAG: hypothetical protein NC115_07155 [Bacteroidales bacterium]|nr:hypothetical protein [Bacteroidales bacterium]
MKKMSGKYLNFISSSTVALALCMLLCHSCIVTDWIYGYQVVIKNDTDSTIYLTDISSDSYPEEITLKPQEQFEINYSERGKENKEIIDIFPSNITVTINDTSITMDISDVNLEWNMCRRKYYKKSKSKRHSTYTFTFTDEIVEELLAGIQE